MKYTQQIWPIKFQRETRTGCYIPAKSLIASGPCPKNVTETELKRNKVGWCRIFQDSLTFRLWHNAYFSFLLVRSTVTQRDRKKCPRSEEGKVSRLQDPDKADTEEAVGTA